jgi:hypothetical protein
MTATLQAFHGAELKLNVLQFVHRSDDYRRMIVLTHERTGRVVEFGIVRIHLHLIPEVPRKEILGRAVPLGDILVRHNVLRSIDPLWFLRFHDGSPVLSFFGSDVVTEAYGRIGVIHCNGEPAVELLEVVPAPNFSNSALQNR